MGGKNNDITSLEHLHQLTPVYVPREDDAILEIKAPNELLQGHTIASSVLDLQNLGHRPIPYEDESHPAQILELQLSPLFRVIDAIHFFWVHEVGLAVAVVLGAYDDDSQDGKQGFDKSAAHTLHPIL